jgi:hypothetical protein
MVISKDIRDFLDSLIEYYTSEAESYRQIAQQYVPEISSVRDTTFGIISGLIYAGFLQMYQNQQKTTSVEDIQEFNEILKEKAGSIKDAISEDEDDKEEEEDDNSKEDKSDSELPSEGTASDQTSKKLKQSDAYQNKMEDIKNSLKNRLKDDPKMLKLFDVVDKDITKLSTKEIEKVIQSIE